MAICLPHPAQTSDLEPRSGGLINRHPSHPIPLRPPTTSLSTLPSAPGQPGPGDGGQTWGQRPGPEIHTGKRTGRPPPRPSHARGGGGAQQLGFAGWCVPTRRTTLPAGARQLLEVLTVLCVSEGLGASTRDAKFVGTWLCVGGRSLQASLARCHLGAPSQDQDPTEPQPREGVGRSLSGWPLGTLLSSPISQPHWCQWGGAPMHHAMPARKPPKEFLLYFCLSFLTSSGRERPKGARPRPASLSLL